MVKGIEQFGSKLKVANLIEPNILRDCEIEVRESRTAHDSNAGISEGLRCRAGDRERARIEPAFDGSL